MPLTEERIKEVLTRDIQTKTLLVEVLSLDKTKKEYLDNGWKLVKESQVNGFYKLTFQKVDKAK